MFTKIPEKVGFSIIRPGWEWLLCSQFLACLENSRQFGCCEMDFDLVTALSPIGEKWFSDPDVSAKK